MNSKQKRAVSVIFFLLTFGVIVVIGLLDSNKIDIGEALTRLHPVYLLLALLSMAVFWLMDSHMIQFCTSNCGANRISFMTGVRIALIGQMYSALTPSSIGGQPMQVYFLSKHEVPSGAGTSVMVVKFIAYQAVACGLFLFAVYYKFSFFMSTFGAYMALMIFGFCVSFVALAVAILSMIKPEGVRRAAHKVLSFLHRIKLIKNIEKRRAAWDKTLLEYGASITYIKRFKLRLLWVFAAHVIHLVAYFAVTFFIYRACGLSEMDVVDIVSLQAILYLAVSYVPLPGASVASEGGFMLVLSSAFGGWTFTAMALWRVITYYGNIAAGAVALVAENLLSRRLR